VKVPVVNL